MGLRLTGQQSPECASAADASFTALIPPSSSCVHLWEHGAVITCVWAQMAISVGDYVYLVRIGGLVSDF